LWAVHRAIYAQELSRGDIARLAQVVSEAAEADIPLLTEVVAAAPLFAPHPDALATQLGAALSDWLAERLPAAFASASEQLLAELDSQARATLLPRLAEIIAHHRRQADH
ncbi:MAG: hypothetical protein N2690_10330, partial [Rhodocyclaceae bacterium]|nr:hypothetical protein [Rhodocyclaceae bacterium]